MTQKIIWISPTEYISYQESNSKKSLSQMIATRERSIDFMGAFSLYLPNPDPILKKLGKDITVYRDLLGDAHVSATVESRKAGVLSLEWAIDRGKAKSRQAKLIEEVFKNLDLNRIIRGILIAPLFGYSPLEIMWERMNGNVLPKDLVGKPPEWFNFGVNNELQFRTIQKWTGEPVPKNKFLVATHNSSYDNPYGESVLSKCFWPVTFKRGGMKFWVVFTEKYGMPFLVGKLPVGYSEQERDSLLDMLDKMVRDAIAVISEQSSVDILESSGKGSSADIFERLLTFSNSEISKAVVGQTLTTELTDTGSYSASQTHMEVKHEIVMADKKIVEQTLNDLIKLIYQINFGTTDNYPTFSMYEEEDVDKALAERDQILTQTGVRFSKEYFRKNYALEEEDFEVKEPQLPSPIFSHPSSYIESERAGKQGQDAIDDLGSYLSDNKVRNQKIAEKLLKPVITLIKKSTSFEEVFESLASLYPDLNDKELENLVTQALFIAENFGRITATEG